MPRKEREVLNLQCKLTEEELRVKAIDHTDVLNQIDAIEDDLKSYNKQIKATIEQKGGEESILRDQVSTGREMRPVECRIEYDWEKKEKKWVRSDTGTVARQEPISEYEYQEEMDLREKEKVQAECEAGQEEVVENGTFDEDSQEPMGPGPDEFIDVEGEEENADTGEVEELQT